MNSLGFIETLGLIAAIEAADSMVKAANVNLRTKTYVGKGLVTVIVEGDVGAVKAAVEAGVDSVKHLGMQVISCNVIPSPVDELSIFIDSSENEDEEVITQETSENEEVIIQEIPEIVKDEVVCEKVIEEEKQELDSNAIIEVAIESKEQLDILVSKYGLVDIENSLVKLTNKQLRSIIINYDEEAVKVLKLQKMNKKELINYIKTFYEK